MKGTSFGRLMLAGLRARPLLTLGSLLLAVVGIGAAVLGPMYQQAATNSFLVARLQTTETFLTGLTWKFTPQGETASDPQLAQDSLSQTLDATVSDEFIPAQTTLVSNPFPIDNGEARLMARDGACDHLQVEGRCPSEPDEILMWADDAAFTSTSVGDEVELAGVGPFTVVGTYTLAPAEVDFWFDAGRLTSVRPVADSTPPLVYQPAPLITTADAFKALPAGSWTVIGDRLLKVGSDTTVSDLSRAADDVARLDQKPHDVDAGTLEARGRQRAGGCEEGDARPAEHGEAQRRTGGAVADPGGDRPAAAADGRGCRPATLGASLASLRGLSGRRLWPSGSPSRW